LIHQVLDLLRHWSVYLNNYASGHQTGIYVVLCLVVFCETGLVVTPFLPGDSLLFAVGALAAGTNSPINLPLICVLLIASANCGDLLNYAIGKRLGPRVFSAESSWLLNKKHLKEAHEFYERHGRKTIIIARFVPIIRTFAPFVAGIGQMPFKRFVGFSVFGGALWVVLVSLAGYFFGQIPFVRSHFEWVVLTIVAVSVLPVIAHAINSRRKGQATAEARTAPTAVH
jgi:membrane-associated protein